MESHLGPNYRKRLETETHPSESSIALWTLARVPGPTSAHTHEEDRHKGNAQARYGMSLGRPLMPLEVGLPREDLLAAIHLARP